MTVLDARAVATRTVALANRPSGVLSDPVQVIGRLLGTPLVAGQAFTDGCFVEQGSGPTLAGALGEGRRAVTLALPAEAALTGLLYPGGVVDVLASFRVPDIDGTGRTELASVTILRGIQVLAIDDKIVGSRPDAETAESARSNALANARSKRGRLVTLMVTAKEAEILQISQVYGKVSLTMRNPTELPSTEDSATLLSQISELFQRKARLARPEAPVATATAAGATPSAWSVIVLRGGKAGEEKLPTPGGMK